MKKIADRFFYIAQHLDGMGVIGIMFGIVAVLALCGIFAGAWWQIGTVALSGLFAWMCLSEGIEDEGEPKQ